MPEKYIWLFILILMFYCLRCYFLVSECSYYYLTNNKGFLIKFMYVISMDSRLLYQFESNDRFLGTCKKNCNTFWYLRITSRLLIQILSYLNSNIILQSWKFIFLVKWIYKAFHSRSPWDLVFLITLSPILFISLNL